MLRLEKEISFKRGVRLDREVSKLLKQQKIICRALNRRPVFLTRYSKCIEDRRDKTRRQQKLLPALELINRASAEDLTRRGKSEFDLRGVTPKGFEVGVHIREQTEKGNRKLFLISTF